MSATIDAAPISPLAAEDRRAALERYAILDTDREAEFDDIVAMAAKACDTPIAYINLLDGRRQWFKAEVGMGCRELPADLAICTHTIDEAEILTVRDLAADPRFAQTRHLLGGKPVRFYAGVPLRTPEGVPIGSLCVADHRPRELDAQQVFILKALARTVMAQLEARKAILQRDRALADGLASENGRCADEHRSRQVLDSAVDYAIVSTDLDGLVTGWNQGARLILGWTEAEMLGQPIARFYTAEDVATGVPGAEMKSALVQGHGTDERWHIRKTGELFWADGEMMALRDEAGGVTGFLKILRDRTERRLAERNLRESNERFDAALASGILGFLDWNAETGLVRGDDRVAAFYGVTRADASAGIAPHILLERVHPADREATRSSVGAGVANGAAFTSEFRVVLPGDDQRWLLLSGCAYPATPTRPLRFTAVLIDVTASRSAEAALRASEELNRRVLASSGDRIEVLGLDGAVQFVNDGAAPGQALGGPSSLVGRPFADLFRDDHGLEIGAALAVARAGRTGRFRALAAPASGGQRWWDVAVTPILDEDGAPERLLAVSRDVTAEIEAERERLAVRAERDAERVRLKAVLDSAPVGIVFAEASGRIVGRNPMAERIFRHPLPASDDLAHAADWDLYRPHGESVPADRHPLVRALRTGETSAGEEYRYRRGDGSLGWIQLTAAPIREASGGISGGVVCIEDIDARKAAEAGLRRLNETLEAAVTERTRELDRLWRLARDMLCVLRLDGTFLRVNPAWATTLGWSAAELLDHPVETFVHPDDQDRVAATMSAAARGAGVTGFESRYRHRDGGHRWLSWSTVTHDGLIYGITRDVTAEKEAAAALAKAEDQLRQSQKMEAVGQLTGGIAHDFNNLLTGITGALDLMGRRIAQGRTGDVDRYAKVALQSANRAAALTHRLLAFSRRQPLDPRSVDGNALVTSMEDLLRRTLGESIVLDVSLAPGLWPTLCDPHQLENALLNLVINARDAMPDGGRLSIVTDNATLDATYAAENDALPGPYVRLSVIDTGRGMEPEVMARAFEPFFTTKPLGQGTGLGLSMIYGFVKQSDGHVRIDSEAGSGTAVSLYLPRAESLVAGEADRGDAGPVREGVGETVLVVEDEPSVRSLVSEVLADLGYRALQAADGSSGLRVLQGRDRVDLLVTDVGLPGMNGRQLAEQGRLIWPDLKVLFITGYAENATFGDGYLDPGMQMLTKPFTIDALAGRIRQMIEGA